MPKPAELEWVRQRDDLAIHISNLWQREDDARIVWKELQREKRNYIYATDTKGTSNSKLPWKNNTTLPKLCQIRDNLHANYMAALFPHDEWLQWEADDEDSAAEATRRVIEAYMQAKLREQNFETTVSRMVYDYIDGNVIGDVVWEANYKALEDSGETVANYIGPKIIRISPFDHVFDPTAQYYKDAHKITRYLKTIGQLRADAKE